MRSGSHQMQHGQEIAAKLKSDREAQAREYGLSVDVLNILTSDPPKWKKFIESGNTDQGEPTETQPFWADPQSPVPPEGPFKRTDELNSTHHTQKSFSDGTSVDTSKWNADWKGAGMLGKARKQNK